MQLSAKVNRVCDVYNNSQGKLRRNYVGPGLYSEPNEFTLPKLHVCGEAGVPPATFNVHKEHAKCNWPGLGV